VNLISIKTKEIALKQPSQAAKNLKNGFSHKSFVIAQAVDKKVQ